MARKTLLIFVAAALPLSPLLAFCSHGEETHLELLGRCHAAEPACCAHAAPDVPRSTLECPGVSHTRAPHLEARIEGFRRDLPGPAPRVADLAGEIGAPGTSDSLVRPLGSARSPGIPSQTIPRLPLLL